MAEIRSRFRAAIGSLFGSIGSLIVFGLSLALFWNFAPPSTAFKLIGLYLSSGLALFAGGFLFSWQGKIEGFLMPALSGFFLGCFSAAYILGPILPVLGLACCAAISAALGALLYQRWADCRLISGEG